MAFDNYFSGEKFLAERSQGDYAQQDGYINGKCSYGFHARNYLTAIGAIKTAFATANKVPKKARPKF